MKDEALQTLVELYEEFLAFVEKNGGWEATSALVLTRIISITYKYFIAPLSAILIYLGYISYEYAVVFYEKYKDGKVGQAWAAMLRDKLYTHPAQKRDSVQVPVDISDNLTEEQSQFYMDEINRLQQEEVKQRAVLNNQIFEAERVASTYNEEEYELDHEDDNVTLFLTNVEEDDEV